MLEAWPPGSLFSDAPVQVTVSLSDKILAMLLFLTTAYNLFLLNTAGASASGTGRGAGRVGNGGDPHSPYSCADSELEVPGLLQPPDCA